MPAEAIETERETRTTVVWIVVLLVAGIAEGALRKWVLPPQFHSVAYLAKDLLGGMFLWDSTRRHTQELKYGYIRVACCLIGALLIPSLIIGLLAVTESAIINYKNAVMWPAIASFIALRTNKAVLRRICVFLAVVAVLMAALGMMQFASPSTALINRYAWTDSDSYVPVASFLIGGTRASGTFSYIAGMSVFGIFAFCLGLWVTSISNSRLERTTGIVLMCAGAISALSTGARATIVAIGIALSCTVLISNRVSTQLRIVMALSVAIGLAVSLTGDGIITAFLDRWQSTGDTMIGRISGEGLRGDYVEILLDHPFGIGLGQATGFAALTNGGVVYDHGQTNGLLEAGFPGAFAQIALILLFVRISFSALLSGSVAFRLGLGAFAPLIYIISNCIWYEHNASCFYWLGIGLWLSTASRDEELGSGGGVSLDQPRQPDFGEGAVVCEP